MKLIADSGSTKTQWNCAGNDFFTEGINPFFLSENEIKTLINNELSAKFSFDEISEIYFYGAGCTAEKSIVLQNALATTFPNAKIEVESDLLGAARTLLQHSAGIACILGTGSNSCFYDGEKIIANVPSLGFILGDEGSGAALGKSLISNILKKMLSENIINKFEEKYPISTAEIIENVYRRPFANRYLAGFCEFLLENQDEPEVDALILNEFQSFFDRNIAKYDFRNFSVNFVGSVAFHFSRQLRQVAGYNEFRIEKIVQSPMEGLVEFHL